MNVPHLVDTSIVVRRLSPDDPQHTIARDALLTLRQRNEIVYITPQVMIEFWAVATRPESANGFGLTATEASGEVEQITKVFRLLPDTDKIYHHWLQLVNTYGIIGRNIYDARLVAVMMTYQIPNIVTLNPKDFRRFSSINVIEPHSLVGP